MLERLPTRTAWAASVILTSTTIGCGAIPSQTEPPRSVVQVPASVESASDRAEPVQPELALPRDSGLVLSPVADDLDPLATATGLGDGVTLSEEFVHCGAGNMCTVHFAATRARQAESAEAARTRLERALAAIDIPPDTRWAVQRMDDMPPDGTTPAPGWRSLLLRREVVVRGKDVTAASLHEDEYGLSVQAELSASAAERFADYTREHIRTRLAIQLEGVVESAPVIMSEIGGGSLRITLGSSSGREQAQHVLEVLRAAGGGR